MDSNISLQKSGERALPKAHEPETQNYLAAMVNLWTHCV